MIAAIYARKSNEQLGADERDPLPARSRTPASTPLARGRRRPVRLRRRRDLRSRVRAPPGTWGCPRRTCGLCRRSGGRELRYYACTSHYLRGPSVCANKVQVPMEAVDRAVLGSIRELLTPDIAHHVLTRVHELVDAQVASDPRAPIAAELADICARLVNLAKAIAACGSLPEFIEDAQALEARRQRLIELLVSRESARASEHTASRLAVLESHAYQMLD